MKASVRNTAALAASVVLLFTLPGCATQPHVGEGARAAAVAPSEGVRVGVVESMREVALDRKDEIEAATLGILFSSILGSIIGESSGAVIGSVGGTLLGGLLALSVERNAPTVAREELSIRLPDGTLVVVVQKSGAVPPVVGGSVRLVPGAAGTRAEPI
jgi:outer membrane lipoprotein SlyB